MTIFHFLQLDNLHVTISTSQLYVYNPVGNSTDGKISVFLDISVFATKCECNSHILDCLGPPWQISYLFSHIQVIGLDIQDDLGRHEVGLVMNTFKSPMNNGEGCRMKTSFKINKVPGNFHVSTQ